MDNCSLRLRLWRTLHLPNGGMGKGEMPSPFPCPSMPVTVGRADPEIMGVGEVVLNPTYSSPWQSSP